MPARGTLDTLQRLVVVAVALCGASLARADCEEPWIEATVGVVATEGRSALRRRVERLVGERDEGLVRCFRERAIRGRRPEPREAQVSITVHPDGHVDADVRVAWPPGASGDVDREADEERGLAACLRHQLSGIALPRPWPATPSPIAIRLRARIVHHPGRRCSDPGGVVH
jgi:hypothetical protein